MHLFQLAFSICLAFVSAMANAEVNELSGTWKFDKSVIYATKDGIPPPREHRTIQIISGSVALRPTCDMVTEYKKESYLYNDFFQMALKGGVDETAMANFTKKHLDFDLASMKSVYVGSKLTKRCATGFNRLFATKDKLIFAGSGGSFDSYKRTDGGVARKMEPAINLYGRKLSHLPYSASNFTVLCLNLLPRVNYSPGSTDKCAPVMYPYVASKSDADPLARTIGTHNYKKNGADGDSDYDNPVAHNLHPVFMLLPPLKDIVVVAVHDAESGDARPGTGAIFISIRNNKVVDQINAKCTLNEDYSCTDGAMNKRYQLLDTGKFQKIGK